MQPTSEDAPMPSSRKISCNCRLLSRGWSSKENGWKRIVTHSGALNDLALSGFDGSGAPEILRTDNGYRVEEMERCDAGLTECEALVAQTGSVLVEIYEVP